MNGSDASIIYSLNRPLQIQIGSPAQPGWKRSTCRTSSSSTRPRATRAAGDPLVAFRYDQDAEFIDAIRNRRPCATSFFDGARVQAVMDAAVLSDSQGRWVDVQAV